MGVGQWSKPQCENTGCSHTQHKVLQQQKQQMETVSFFELLSAGRHILKLLLRNSAVSAK